VLSATCFGLAYAAARLALATVWPLALLHALADFSNDNATAPVPAAVHLAHVVICLLYGIYVLARLRNSAAVQLRHEPRRF
jgi:hypothetical protein